MWGNKARLLVVKADPEGKHFGGWLLSNHDGSVGEKLLANRNVAGLNQRQPTFIQDPYSFYIQFSLTRIRPACQHQHSSFLLSCSNGSECNTVLLKLPFHLPTSKTSLRSQRTSFGDEAAQTVCIYVWVVFSPNHTMGLSPSDSACLLCCPTWQPNTVSTVFFLFPHTDLR